MNLVFVFIGFVALYQLLFDVRNPCGREDCRQPVHVGDDLIGDGVGLDFSRPADHGRDAVGTFPVGVFLAAERGHGGIGPGVHVGPIVCAVEDKGVVCNAELFELVEDGADVLVVVDHGIVVGALPAAGLAEACGLDVGAEMHVGEVDPDKERFARFVLLLNKVGRPGSEVIIDGLHALFGQGTGVFNGLLSIGQS